MTDADNKPTPFPARPVHDIPPLGRNARDSNGLAPARPQNGNMSVGPGIQLKGEISNCTTLIVEGDVDATLDGTALEIVQHGVFCGTARVESANIQGRFEGDITVSGLLRVESGGSASGKLCYGQLEVAVGGDLTGEISKNTDEDRKSAADDSIEVTDEDDKSAADDSVEVTDEDG
jgi:cytoskeletal protein CcmA (bactofilin family)